MAQLAKTRVISGCVSLSRVCSWVLYRPTLFLGLICVCFARLQFQTSQLLSLPQFATSRSSSYTAWSHHKIISLWYTSSLFVKVVREFKANSACYIFQQWHHHDCQRKKMFFVVYNLIIVIVVLVICAHKRAGCQTEELKRSPIDCLSNTHVKHQLQCFAANRSLKSQRRHECSGNI